MSDLPKINPKHLVLLAGFSISVVVVVVFLFLGIHSIDVGEAGVVFDKQAGVVEKQPLTLGWKWVTPVINSVTIFDTREQKETLKLSAASSDSQVVTTEVTVNYIITAEDWPYVYQYKAKDMDSLREKIIDPQIQEILKASTAKFKGEDLIPKRELVKLEVSSKLAASLTKSHITVTEVSLTDFQFDPEYQNAIERKQVAYQDFLTAQNRKQQEQINADIVVIQANASAEQIRVKGKALRDNPQLVNLIIAERWDGILPEVVYEVGGEGPTSVILNPQKTAAARAAAA